MSEKQELIRSIEAATPIFQKITENEKFAAKYPKKRAFDKVLTFLMMILAAISVPFWVLLADEIINGNVFDIPLIVYLLLIFLDLPFIVCIIGLIRAKMKYKGVLAENEKLVKSPELEWIPMKYRDTKSFDQLSDAVYSGRAKTMEEACAYLVDRKSPENMAAAKAEAEIKAAVGAKEPVEEKTEE